MIAFGGKPSDRVRGILKANGFRWSPAGGHWWRAYSVRGKRIELTPLVDALRRIIDMENGVPPKPDGNCWNCGAAEGYFRHRGAAAPVWCDTCHQRVIDDERRRDRPDPVDMAYEDDCARQCGL